MSNVSGQLWSPPASSRPNWSWVSLLVYLALVGAWASLSINRLGDVVLPYVALHYFPSALIFAGGLLAYARVRGAWQKALALQVALLLSPGTGDLVSRVFWSAPFESMHGQPVPLLTTLAIYAGFGLPWLLLMFAPALLAWPARTAPRRPGMAGLGARPAVDRGLALRWTLATTVGWAAILSAAILGPVGTLLWTLLLLLPGVLQWLVVRRQDPQAGWWVVASAAGQLVGTYLAASRQLLDLYLARRDGLDSLLAYSTLGATLGLAQWLVLRRWSPKAHWWILANLLAWPLGWAAGAALGALLSWPWMVGIEPVWTACIAGLATGVVLAWLLPATSRV